MSDVKPHICYYGLWKNVGSYYLTLQMGTLKKFLLNLFGFQFYLDFNFSLLNNYLLNHLGNSQTAEDGSELNS